MCTHDFKWKFAFKLPVLWYILVGIRRFINCSSFPGSFNIIYSLKISFFQHLEFFISYSKLIGKIEIKSRNPNEFQKMLNFPKPKSEYISPFKTKIISPKQIILSKNTDLKTIFNTSNFPYFLEKLNVLVDYFILDKYDLNNCHNDQSHELESA